ncbi:hypothetical protein XENORESO_005963 [Xenotaenia resolanae]|uniref:Uncharacterized protein n=1 Tax=Xenotaenia resolanae TaxID=208358 RepID=A0ABV0WDB3_9TELE
MPCGACLRISRLECLVERLNHTMPVPENKAVETLTLLEVFKEDCQEGRKWGCWAASNKEDTGNQTDARVSLCRWKYERKGEEFCRKDIHRFSRVDVFIFPYRHNQPVCKLQPSPSRIH